MRMIVTGDEEVVAHSAWISTLDETKAKKRGREDILKVVRFLIDNNHTSPLESITISVELERNDNEEIKAMFFDYLDAVGLVAESGEFRYHRFSDNIITIDLLNFCKVTSSGSNPATEEVWALYKKERPILAAMLSQFGPIKEGFTEDVSDQLGDHNLGVELIQLHDVGYLNHSRATWRIKCPLSIATQILRHRKGSFNQVSGRYRTIRQEFVYEFEDCKEIAEKAGESLSRYFGVADSATVRYLQFMRRAKKARDNNSISNKEYKRLREVARYILPEGRMTEIYVTFYLDDFYDNYLLLRDSSHAQTEHIWIAQEMRKTLEAVRPPGEPEKLELIEIEEPVAEKNNEKSGANAHTHMQDEDLAKIVLLVYKGLGADNLDFLASLKWDEIPKKRRDLYLDICNKAGKYVIIKKLIGDIRTAQNLPSEKEESKEYELDLEPIRKFFDCYTGGIVTGYSSFEKEDEVIDDKIAASIISGVCVEDDNIVIDLSSYNGQPIGAVKVKPSRTGEFMEKFQDDSPTWASKFRIDIFGGITIEYVDSNGDVEINFVENQ